MFQKNSAISIKLTGAVHPVELFVETTRIDLTKCKRPNCELAMKDRRSLKHCISFSLFFLVFEIVCCIAELIGEMHCGVGGLVKPAPIDLRPQSFDE